LLITEVNWPLKGTAPYAPTSETECVSEEEYRDYMLAYHQMAFATQMVETVYWHQLIAPGYGLIDPRSGRASQQFRFNEYRRMLLSVCNAA